MSQQQYKTISREDVIAAALLFPEPLQTRARSALFNVVTMSEKYGRQPKTISTERVRRGFNQLIGLFFAGDEFQQIIELRNGRAQLKPGIGLVSAPFLRAPNAGDKIVFTDAAKLLAGVLEIPFVSTLLSELLDTYAPTPEANTVESDSSRAIEVPSVDLGIDLPVDLRWARFRMNLVPWTHEEVGITGRGHDLKRNEPPRRGSAALSVGHVKVRSAVLRPNSLVSTQGIRCASSVFSDARTQQRVKNMLAALNRAAKSHEVTAELSAEILITAAEVFLGQSPESRLVEMKHGCPALKECVTYSADDAHFSSSDKNDFRSGTHVLKRLLRMPALSELLSEVMQAHDGLASARDWTTEELAEPNYGGPKLVDLSIGLPLARAELGLVPPVSDLGLDS